MAEGMALDDAEHIEHSAKTTILASDQPTFVDESTLVSNEPSVSKNSSPHHKSKSRMTLPSSTDDHHADGMKGRSNLLFGASPNPSRAKIVKAMQKDPQRLGVCMLAVYETSTCKTLTRNPESGPGPPRVRGEDAKLPSKTARARCKDHDVEQNWCGWTSHSLRISSQ